MKAEQDFVVFRGPLVEAFDRVGRKGIIEHQWVAKESKELASKLHANIKPPNENDNNPGPSWCYTVLAVPFGYKLDNRVFSNHDYDVTPHDSTPERTFVDDLGEEVLSFHIMWRIALKGTEELLDDEDKVSLKDRIKARRTQNNGNTGGGLSGLGNNNNNNNSNNNSNNNNNP